MTDSIQQESTRADKLVQEQSTCVWAILSIIFAIIFPLLGLIFGIVALSKIKKDSRLKGRGLAIVGIVLSVLFIILFLFILFIISPLAYFGVVEPTRLLPERCEFPPGLDCVDRAGINAETDTVELAIKNDMGFPIRIIDIQSDGEDCPVSSFELGNSEASIANNQQSIISIQCGGGGIKEGKFKERFTLTYRNEENKLTHSAVGMVRGRAG